MDAHDAEAARMRERLAGLGQDVLQRALRATEARRLLDAAASALEAEAAACATAEQGLAKAVRAYENASASLSRHEDEAMGLAMRQRPRTYSARVMS